MCVYLLMIWAETRTGSGEGVRVTGHGGTGVGSGVGFHTGFDGLLIKFANLSRNII